MPGIWFQVSNLGKNFNQIHIHHSRRMHLASDIDLHCNGIYFLNSTEEVPIEKAVVKSKFG